MQNFAEVFLRHFDGLSIGSQLNKGSSHPALAGLFGRNETVNQLANQ